METVKKKQGERSQKDKASVRKRGGQPGNKNSKGKQNAKGHGAPKGTQNALKHGGYSAVYWDTLDEDERELIESMPQEEPMNLKQLIYKRLVHAKDIGGLLAKYAGHPAVFDTEAPDDKQDGWEGKTQYPRLNIVLDMQANEERSSVGSLTITIYTERTSMVILEIESLVKTCFRDLLISPEDGGPYSFAWARTDPFSIEGTNVIGQDVTFDIMEYSAQETTDPDPIVALSRYIKKLYPDSIVLGVDPVGEFTEASVTPIFYSRLVTMDKATGHNMNIVTWMDCRMAVHLLCPDKAMNLKMLAAVMQKISVDEKIILLDNSPMNISEVQIDKQADYLKQGQLYVTGRFGVLKYKEKPHAIESIITM